MITVQELYPGRHRGQRNHAMDVAKKNGTPHIPAHSTDQPADEDHTAVSA